MLVLGGFAILAVGGAAYAGYKLSTRDVQRVEEQTGKSADDLTEEELVAAMEDLGIEKIELTDDDRAEISKAESAA